MKIYLNEKVHKKVMHWINKTHHEVSGFGLTEIVKVNEEPCCFVREVFLLEQEVGGAHTDIDAKSLGKLMHHVLKDENLRKFQLNWWWHSHVNMNVFWSGTDRETIESIGKNGLCVASVFNKKNEVRSAVCYKANHELLGESLVFNDDLETKVLLASQQELSAWDKEFDECVKSKTYQQTSFIGEYYDRETRTWKKKDERTESAESAEDGSHLVDKETWDYGICGYGILEEADLINVKPLSIARALKNNELKIISFYEDRIWQALELKGNSAQQGGLNESVN